MLLRDGSHTDDPRLDRLLQFDERSRNFGIAEVAAEDIRTKTWRLDERLDQGPDGACVGFGVTHRIAAAPLEVGGQTYDTAFALYKAAQKIDPWPGENYEGTSVLAGVKTAKNLGYFSEYRWCFTVEEIMRAVSNEGPVIVGTWWKDTMFDPDGSNILDCTGRNVGGHCYLIRGLDLRRRGGPYFRITNSWGRDWGKNGDALIRVEDYERYLMPQGEAVVPMEVRKPRKRDERGRFFDFTRGLSWDGGGLRRPRTWSG